MGGGFADDPAPFSRLVTTANELGRLYRKAVSEDDTTRVVGSALLLMTELGMMIPNVDENNDAHSLIGAIIGALLENMHGRHAHPLLQPIPENERIAGVVQKGVSNEYIAGIAAGAVVFLEREGWKTDPACKHVSASLSHWGRTHCGLSTVKKWRDEESKLTAPRSESRRFIGLMTEPSAVRAAKDYQLSGRNNPGPFIRKWLGEQIKATSLLLGL